jgi:hypothetical protein
MVHPVEASSHAAPYVPRASPENARLWQTHLKTAGETGPTPVRYSAKSNPAAGGTSAEPSDSEKDDLYLDLTQMALDIAGIVDPFGVADGTSAGISLYRGDLWGAGASGLGIVLPYLGDLAKLGKLPKWLKTVERVANIALHDSRFAKLVEPVLSKIHGALKSIDLDSLPGWAREPLQKLKTKLDDYFLRSGSVVGSRADFVKPTGAKGGKPGGKETEIHPRDYKTPETVRGKTRENEAAKTLADQEYRIDQNPGRQPNGSSPDYLIEGQFFECKSPGKTKPVKGIWDEVEKSVGRQADRFVLNLDDWGGSIDDLRKQFKDAPISGLKEVLVVKNGKVFNL